MKYTRGPWKVYTYGTKTTIEIKAVGDIPAVVSWLGFDDCHRKHSEHLANARLIAAAPLMYEAPQEIANTYVGSFMSDPVESVQMIVDIAQAALDAAGGE